MPREEAQEAAKLLFINAGESKEQVVEGYYRVDIVLTANAESKLQQNPGTWP